MPGAFPDAPGQGCAEACWWWQLVLCPRVVLSYLCCTWQDQLVLIAVFFFFCWGGVVRRDISLWDLVPQPGIKPRPQQWKCRVLTIGPPGSPNLLLGDFQVGTFPANSRQRHSVGMDAEEISTGACEHLRPSTLMQQVKQPRALKW